MQLRKLDEAERVLQGSLRVHPGVPATQVHLGRIALFRGDMPKAKLAYREALAGDPFDEEIHLALVKIDGALGDTALRDRARKAVVTLTGLAPEQVDAAAKQFASTDEKLADDPVAPDQAARAPRQRQRSPRRRPPKPAPAPAPKK